VKREKKICELLSLLGTTELKSALPVFPLLLQVILFLRQYRAVLSCSSTWCPSNIVGQTATSSSGLKPDSYIFPKSSIHRNQAISEAAKVFF